MCTVYSSSKTALSHNYLYIAFPYPKYNSVETHMKIITQVIVFLQIFLRDLKLDNFLKIFRKINIRL